MSKELKALERLRDTLLAEGYWQDVLQDVAIIETALKDYEDYKTKPRKKGFAKQDNRLRLAYQEMGRYSKNKEVPQELRGKPYGDIIGIVPKDEERRWDLYLLFNMLLYRPIQDRQWDKDKNCFVDYPCLLQELENRGYDVKTIYFEIAKRNKKRKYRPFKNYLLFSENFNFDYKTEQKKLKALNEILYLHDKWLGNEMSDFEFFTLLSETRDKYDLLKEELK